MTGPSEMSQYGFEVIVPLAEFDRRLQLEA
jgi:hypothetical protein